MWKLSNRHIYSANASSLLTACTFLSKHFEQAQLTTNLLKSRNIIVILLTISIVRAKIHVPGNCMMR